MFIRLLDIVDIVDGRKAGARGMVQDIVICGQGSGVVNVYVQVINLQTGGFDLMMFKPEYLRRAKMRPISEEMLKQFALAAAEEQEQQEQQERRAA